MSDLKPCPFCGGPVELEEANPTHDRLYGERRWWGVVCRNTINRGGSCAIYQRPSASKEAAIERWNRRAQPAQAGQVLSDDELLTMWAGDQPRPTLGKNKVLAYGRAIEQAVMAKRVPQWLPIETAPKDGTRVMVWMNDQYASNQHAFAKLWFYQDGKLGGGAEGYSGDWSISHWMPLPPPPGIVGEKGRP